MIANIDAQLDNADWTKQTWDLPVDNLLDLRRYIARLGMTTAQFMELPVYRHALASHRYPWLAALKKSDEFLTEYEQRVAGGDQYLDEPRDDHGRWTGGGSGGEGGGEAGGSATGKTVAHVAIDELHKSGGFSLTKDGQKPEGRYFASYSGQEEKIPLAKITPDSVHSYYDAHASMLASNPNNVLGGWHNPDDGQVYLDVSRGFNSQSEVETFAGAHQQLAYYDAQTGGSYYHQPDGSWKVQKGATSKLSAAEQAAKLKAMIGHPIALSRHGTVGATRDQSS